MLELRPNCELCDRDLPPHARDARICSYECTFCADCVAGPLANVCPNCGGGFVPRPIRPRHAWRPQTSVADDPPASARRHVRYGPDEIAAFVAAVGAVPAHDR